MRRKWLARFTPVPIAVALLLWAGAHRPAVADDYDVPYDADGNWEGPLLCPLTLPSET